MVSFLQFYQGFAYLKHPYYDFQDEILVNTYHPNPHL